MKKYKCVCTFTTFEVKEVEEGEIVDESSIFYEIIEANNLKQAISKYLNWLGI